MFYYLHLTHLVPEHSDGGGGAHLAGGEPRGGQLCGDAEDEDLAGRHHRLASEGEPPLGRPRAEHLEPGAQARAGRPQQHAQSQTLPRVQTGQYWDSLVILLNYLARTGYFMEYVSMLGGILCNTSIEILN